jgi:hypothetical protein
MFKNLIYTLVIICLGGTYNAWSDDRLKKAYDRLTFKPVMSLGEGFRDDAKLRHNVRDYGAVGDGYHDDTQSIEKAVAKATAGETVFFPPGKYMITSPIIIDKSHIAVKGKDAEIIFRPVATRELSFRSLNNGKSFGKKFSSSAFLIKGDFLLPGYKVGGNNTENATRLECPVATEKFAEGDLVVVTNTNHGKKVKLSKKVLYMNREQNLFSRVERVEQSAIVLADPLPFPLEAINKLVVFQISAVVNVELSDLTITIASKKKDVENISGITLIYTAGAVINKVSLRHTLKESINLQHCYQCEISECNLTDMFRFDSQNGLAVNLDRSHFCVIQNNFIANSRHAVLLNHGNSNCVIEHNLIKDARAIAAIDLHGEFNSYNVIRANEISGCKAGIVVGGGGEHHYNDGPFNAVIDNKITDCDIGIQIKNETASTIMADNKINKIKYKNKEIMVIHASEDDIIQIKKSTTQAP